MSSLSAASPLINLDQVIANAPNTYFVSQGFNFRENEFIRAVFPCYQGGPWEPIQGSLYCQIVVTHGAAFDVTTGSFSQPFEVLWNGYLDGGTGVPSIVNRQFVAGETIYLIVWTGSENTSSTIGLLAIKGGSNQGGRWLRDEAPFSSFHSRNVGIIAPAAGANFAKVTVPSYTIWELLGVTFRLNTSATVANRYFAIQVIDSGAGQAQYVGKSVYQPASDNHTYHWGYGATDTFNNGSSVYNAADLGGVLSFSLPKIYLQSGWCYYSYIP